MILVPKYDEAFLSTFTDAQIYEGGLGSTVCLSCIGMNRREAISVAARMRQDQELAALLANDSDVARVGNLPLPVDEAQVAAVDVAEEDA